MTTIAIVGAGRGLGAAVARKFGAEGHDIALISRNQEHLDALAADLTSQGISARGYAANVRDTTALASALDQAGKELGPIEILQYSPIPQREFLRPLLDTTVADLTAAVEFSLYGSVAAVNQVLPGMRNLGRGTVLFVNGGSGARPNAQVAGTSIAFAAEGTYATMLHDILAPENVHIGQLIVPGAITSGHRTNDPTALADTLWGMHTDRGKFRVFTEELDV